MQYLGPEVLSIALNCGLGPVCVPAVELLRYVTVEAKALEVCGGKVAPQTLCGGIRIRALRQAATPKNVNTVSHFLSMNFMISGQGKAWLQ